MSQTTLDSKAENVALASQKITNTKQKSRQKANFKGKFGEATIQNVIEDDQLSENEFVKFELLMPDNETTRYLSFSEEQVRGHMFNHLLDYLETTEQEMNVLYKSIPVTYINNKWQASFKTDIFAKNTRESKFFSVTSQGMFVLTRWSYLTLTIVGGLITSLLYSAGAMGILEFVLCVFASLIFTPLLISYCHMDRMLTGLTTLSDE